MLKLLASIARSMAVLLAVALVILFKSSTGLAAQGANSVPLFTGASQQVAQMDDSGDVYDPFADYSEFQESADEEEDLNFFRNGRFFTIGLMLGYRGFTGNYAQMYTGSPDFGANLSYFFDLRFAMDIGFVTGNHILTVNPSNAPQIVGSMGLTDLMVHIKYYLNTQNVTRGLASLNPYFAGGLSELYRTTHVSGQPVSAKDNAMAFDIGGGIEFPMMNNKMYFGVEGLFQIPNFSDSGTAFPLADGSSSGFIQSGDSYLITSTIGVNF